MLRNRHFQVKVVKDDNAPEIESASTYLIDTSGITKENVEHIIKVTLKIVFCYKVLNTACELVLIRASK